jgi:ferrochelatase
MKHGLLLINLGTPDNPSTSAVRRYLREFLSDERVISLPTPLRYILLYGLILPFRARQSAHAYQSIWMPEGSPLLYHSRNLADKLQDRLGTNCKVILGMRYGRPSIQDALLQLQECETITILPLYPQYSSAATGSSIERVLQLIAKQTTLPSIKVIRDFHSHPKFINAQSELIKPYLATHDYVLFSYHGLPENHLHKSGCKPVCLANCPSTSSIKRTCYRAQCMQTTSLVAKTLGLTSGQYGTAFQSKLGKTPWIKPYTDQIITDLFSQGTRRIAIVCPSFVADCLETLEEIGIRLKEQWMEMGGEQFSLIPCLNNNEHWLDALLSMTDLS